VSVVNGSVGTVTSRHHTRHCGGPAIVTSHHGRYLVFCLLFCCVRYGGPGLGGPVGSMGGPRRSGFDDQPPHKMMRMDDAGRLITWHWHCVLWQYRTARFSSVSVEAKLSLVEPGRRWAYSPSPSKAPGISYQGTMKTSVRMLKTSGGLWLLYGAFFCFCLVCFTWLWASWDVPPGDSGLFVRLLSPVSTSVPVHDSPLWAPRAPGPSPACWAAVASFCFLRRFRWVPGGFFFSEPWLVHLSAAKSWVLVKGFSRGPLFCMFSLSLQSIISNQMRPRRLRGAWFSRLLWHSARRRSGSVLNPGTHTGGTARLMSAACWQPETALLTDQQCPNATCTTSWRASPQHFEMLLTCCVFTWFIVQQIHNRSYEWSLDLLDDWEQWWRWSVGFRFNLDYNVMMVMMVMRRRSNKRLKVTRGLSYLVPMHEMWMFAIGDDVAQASVSLSVWLF